MKEGLYCSGGYNWFSIGSDGRVATCNKFLLMDDRGYIGNILKEDIILRKDEFGFRCPVQECVQICDRHWSRKKIYKDDIEIDYQDIVDSSFHKGIINPVSVLFAPSWKCNFSCRYCGLPSGREEYVVEKWLERFDKFFTLNKIGGGLFQITGGEPLYYKDIDKLFVFLHTKNFKIGLTTNLTGNIYENIISCTTNEYFSSINCSLHPTDKNFKWECFKNGVQLLKLFGYNVSVNFVGYPDQITLAPEYNKWCMDIGVDFSLIPMVGNIDGVRFNTINDYPKPLKDIINSISSARLQDGNKFLDGQRIKS